MATTVSVLDLGGEQKKKPIEFVKVIHRLSDLEIIDATSKPREFRNVKLVSTGRFWDVIAAWNDNADLGGVWIFFGHWNDGVVE